MSGINGTSASQTTASLANAAGFDTNTKTEGNFEQAQGVLSGAWNSTVNAFSGVYESTSSFAGNAIQTVYEGIQSGAEKTNNAVSSAFKVVADALSYNGLAATAENVNGQIASTTSNAWASFTNTTVVTYVGDVTSSAVNALSDATNSGAKFVSDTANSASNTVSNNLPSTNSWLPAAAFGVAAFAGVKSLQAARANFNAGNLKRAATQIFAGACSLAFAGTIAYQSPVGQNTTAYAGSFFSKA